MTIDVSCRFCDHRYSCYNQILINIKYFFVVCLGIFMLRITIVVNQTVFSK